MLLYSVLLSKGLMLTTQELASDFNQQGCLVPTNTQQITPAALTVGLMGTSSMISLLLAGLAAANIGAWSVGADAEFDFPDTMGVGMLSTTEALDLQQPPLNHSLKCAELPVWLVHHRRHFTVLFDLRVSQNSPEEGSWCMGHWDGLNDELLKISVSLKDLNGEACFEIRPISCLDADTNVDADRLHALSLALSTLPIDYKLPIP